MAQQRILLADDESFVRAFVRAILNTAGFDVLEASDGAEAIEIVQQVGGAIDLLVTDVRMPRVDGVALAQALTDIYPDIPILFISGYSFDLEAEQQKRPAKRCGFVQKPFVAKSLLEAVRKCLNSPRQAVETGA
jgi:two-component system cell cycle sensor histidine kinase/response regulator CckA